MKNNLIKINEEEFKEVVVNIKNEIRSAQIKTMKEVNSNLIMLYFKVGKILDENSFYGSSFIKNVSQAIKLEYPNAGGYSERNLNYMKLFYEEYKEHPNLQQVVANLPWGHNLLLMQKIKNIDVRMIYANAAIENGWSRNILDMQIKTNYHLRIGNTVNNFKSTLPAIDSDLVNNTLKDPYIFDFISLRNNYKEKDLEKSMISRIKDVLLELGSGFSFVGNQYKLTVGGIDYYLDLLFYHLKLRCYIVVELKASEFIPEYVGKMNFYLSAVDDLIKDKDDNPSIGLILCRDKNRITARYSLDGINKPIGVTSYELSKYLPSEEVINNYIDL